MADATKMGGANARLAYLLPPTQGGHHHILHCQNSDSPLRILFKGTIMTSEHRKAIFAFDIVDIQNNHLMTKSNHRFQTFDHHHPTFDLVEQIVLPCLLDLYIHTRNVFKCDSVEFANPIHQI